MLPRLVLAGALAGLLPVIHPVEPRGAAAVETLRAISALPASVVNQLDEPLAIVQSSSGEYLLLDRRAHAVFATGRDGRALRRVIEIGGEPGRLLQPIAMTLGGDDIVAVLDAPGVYQRIQYFATNGMRIGGFYLPVVGTPWMVIGSDLVSGAGAFDFTGRTFIVSEPAWGSLFVELDTGGTILRHVGQLRATGHEDDPVLHQALNVGLPLVDPAGGFFYVFQTGVPMFRKYDDDGRILFERHVEGPEIDALIQALPTTWPRERGTRRPLVPPLVRTAAVDPAGRLWVALRAGVTYVYDASGEKIRTVRFVGASAVDPVHFFFPSADRVLVTPGGYEFGLGLGA